jgi:TRAP-type uncharacterized transport system substrate-binding protein
MNKKRFLLFTAMAMALMVLLGVRQISLAQTTVFINEIHYDNSGTDSGEAIEIAGPAGTDLTGWSIVLYNGSNGSSYNTATLSSTIPDQSNGYGTIVVNYPTNGIQNGAPDGIALVGAGERPFAIVSGEQVILARAQELPVVYVLQWFQKYPIAVISKAEAGIERPSDLIGREVGLPGFFGATYVGYLGLLEANGISPEEVTAVDIGFTQVESLLADKTEAVVGYVNNEPIQLATQDVPVNVLPVSDYMVMMPLAIISM